MVSFVLFPEMATLPVTIFLIPIPFFLLSIIIIFKQKHTPLSSSSPARTLSPGPKGLPFIGNLHQLGGSDSIQRLSKQHGPFMFLQLGSIKTLVISSADAARDIFRDHDIIFSGRPYLYAANKLSYERSDISFAPYGQAWRESRKVATLDLLSSKKVQSFNAVRAQETALLVQRIAKYSAAGRRPVNLNKLATLVANNIVSRVTFGKKFESEDDDGGGSSRFDRVLHETQGMLTEFNLADYFPWMKWINRFNGVDSRLDKVFRELDGLFEEMIAEHQDPNRPQIENEDMLDLLLRLQMDPNQNCLNDQQLKGLLVDMFIAGTDTSASTIVWFMAELIKNPTTMKRAQDEVRAAIKEKRRVEESDLHKLSYLKAALKEALRLHPPVPLLLPRESIKECYVSGYRIPAGTRVLIDAKSIGTDPSHWDDPHKFQPERFLDKSVDFRGHHFELIPFGVGRRGCPGVDFAVVVVELAVANLLGGFDWSLPEGMRAEDVDMEEESGITTYKKTPLCLVANCNVDLSIHCTGAEAEAEEKMSATT